LPWRREPEATVVFITRRESYRADDLFGGLFEAEGPVPFFTAGDGGQGGFAVVGEDAIFGEWPRDFGVKVLDDLPLGEEGLDLFGVG